MNFTFTIEWVKAFGGVKNGQWTGMIGIKELHFINYFCSVGASSVILGASFSFFSTGLLKDRKKDFGASAFIMKQSRATVVDYLPTLMPSYQQLFIRNPAEAFDWEAYTLPLSGNAWMAVGIFFLILPLIMVITFYDCKFNYR